MEALKATTAIVMATHMVLLKTTTAMDIHMEILPQIIMATVMHTHMALLKTTIVIFMVIPVEIPHTTIMAIVMGKLVIKMYLKMILMKHIICFRMTHLMIPL